MRKIHRISNVLSTLKLDKVFLKVRQVCINDIPILAYHRIIDLDNIPDYPFDADLISASESDFEWQMQFIKKHFTPIALSTLCDYIDGKIGLPKNPIIVTFDDGFDDNYYTAFPILKKLNIPATIFVASDFIEEEYTIWYEKLAFIVQGQSKDILIPELNLVLEGTSDFEQRRQNYWTIVEKLKVIPNHQRINIMEKLTQEYLNDYSSLDNDIKKLSKPVTWDQLKEMVNSVFEVGSHTMSHPVMTMLTDDELATELADSKSTLEKNLNITVDTIAYPVGMDFAFDDRVKAATQNAGYKIGLSYMEGKNNHNALLPYELKRIHVDRDMPRTAFSTKLAVPKLFTI